MSKNNASKKVAILGLFAAVIIVFQLLSYVIKIGTFNLSFVLIPIVLGAVLYGTRVGTVLGALFGIVVVVCCITGLDGGGYVLFTANPFLTSLICIAKGALAGFVAGIISNCRLRSTKPYLAIILAALAAPIANTGLFCISTLIFFKDILTDWAGGTELMVYIITGIVGINFIIEFILNAVAAPALFRVTNAIKKI